MSSRYTGIIESLDIIVDATYDAWDA